MKERIPVAVLAATGSVGQRFAQLLDKHPWFKVVRLAASDRSVGKPYAQACRWLLADPMPAALRDMRVAAADEPAADIPLVFSALPADAAAEIEALWARAGALVCTNASAFRAEPDVPLLLPEVNPHHTALIHRQRQKRAWQGAVVANPNCTSTGMSVALKALQDAFGLRRVFAVSMQAVSGAGYPGVPSLDILDNVIPFISGEESKVEWEPRKMLGDLEPDGGAVRLADFAISAHTNRVPVSDGHLVCLSVELAAPASPEQAADALRAYQAPAVSADLPSAPRPVISLSAGEDRPQPRLDRNAGGGMQTVVGRVRVDPLFHIKLVVCSHNTIRGAAGGSIYNAELLCRRGFVNYQEATNEP